MRALFRLALLLALATPAVARRGAEPVTDEKLNFSIQPPDSPDWDSGEIDPKSEVKVHYRTEIADTDPTSYAEVRLIVRGLSKEHVRMGPEKIAAQWKDALESHLGNPRDRKEAPRAMGGKDAWSVDLQGDWGPGTHHRTWIIAKQGTFLYLFVVDRTYKAIGDSQIEDEIRQILDSFKYLREEKLAEAKGGGDAEAPGEAGAGVKGPDEPKIDPKLLEKETVREKFWRFQMVKPAGLVKDVLADADKNAGVKVRLSGLREGCALTIYVYAETQASKKYTLEQLSESCVKNFKATRKDPKEPVYDKKFKIPLAEESFRVDLVGRRRSVEKETWIFAECSNERQYRVQILSIAGADRKFAKEIEDLLKNFEPVKESVAEGFPSQ
jgi:hypothetical protein